MFKDNFEQKYKHMPDAIKEAGPKPIEKNRHFSR
jgi:phosphoenolpyruvate carboxykinase (ATP)